MMRRWKFKIGIVSALSFAIVLTFYYYAKPTVVFGDSMLPTLRPWDICWMRRTRPYEPARGDIVMFRTANNPPLRFIKRVIALPGETIAMSNGVVFINSQPLTEPYTTANPSWEFAPTNIPPGRVYVIGDNRDIPVDWALQTTVATRLVEARMISFWRWRK